MAQIMGLPDVLYQNDAITNSNSAQRKKKSAQKQNSNSTQKNSTSAQIRKQRKQRNDKEQTCLKQTLVVIRHI